METSKELLVHELSDMMSAESIIVKLLPELAKEAQTPRPRRRSTRTRPKRAVKSTG